MMKKKSELLYIVVFVGILVLSYFFPLTGEDLFWSNVDAASLVDAIKIKGIGVMPGIILFVLTKLKILRMIFVAIMSTSLVVLLKNTVNKKNVTLSFLALFLILIFDKNVFAHFFVNLSGFTVHLMGSLFLIIFMRHFANNSIVRMKEVFLIILGFFGGLLNPVYVFVIFLSTLIYMLFCKESVYRKKYLMLILGELCGLIVTVFLSESQYLGFSNNLIHEFTNSIRGVNFLCLLIFVALVLFLSIKVFMRESKIYSILSIAGIALMLFVSLLSNNDVLMYISYVAYFFGSFYILLNSKSNKLFKYKVFTYYLFKLLFIIFLCLFGNIESGSIIFLYLVDIIFILEMYDKWLPRNFLKYVWISVAFCFILVNIYIYSSVLKRYDEMNVYIKNELECKTSDVVVPSKYIIDYIYRLLPGSYEEFRDYVEYKKIDLYGEVERSIEFSKRNELSSERK